MVMTTSAPRTASRASSAARPPAFVCCCNARGSMSKPITRWPAFMRLAAIGRPMLPRPMKAIAVIAGTPSILLGKQAAGDDDAHDLVSALQDPVHAQIAQITLDAVFLDVAVAAVQLQRLVAD